MKKIINALLKTTTGRIILEMLFFEFKRFMINKLLSSDVGYRGEIWQHLETSLDETIREFLNSKK